VEKCCFNWLAIEKTYFWNDILSLALISSFCTQSFSWNMNIIGSSILFCIFAHLHTYLQLTRNSNVKCGGRTSKPLTFRLFLSYHPLPRRDPISRPITPIYLVAGRDDTTRRRRQETFRFFYLKVAFRKCRWIRMLESSCYDSYTFRSFDVKWLKIVTFKQHWIRLIRYLSKFEFTSKS
jgi:hypothetical protein